MNGLIRRVEALERIAPPAGRLVIWRTIIGPGAVNAPMARANVEGLELSRDAGETEAQFLERATTAALAAVPAPRVPRGIAWSVGH